MFDILSDMEAEIESGEYTQEEIVNLTKENNIEYLGWINPSKELKNYFFMLK